MRDHHVMPTYTLLHIHTIDSQKWGICVRMYVCMHVGTHVCMYMCKQGEQQVGGWVGGWVVVGR